MKKIMLNLIKKGLFAVAVFAAATPSQAYLYQKESPKALNKFKI